MSEINKLSSLSASDVSGSDHLVVYSASNGSARKLSLTNHIGYLNTSFARQDYVTTVATPGDGFTQTVTDDGLSRWILLRPTGSLATGTIVLPSSANASDGQEILVTTTEAITTLTINANGASEVNGAPTTLAAGGKFTLRYNLLTTSWYAVA